MPNTVPAAATGLPKLSRRNVVSALAATAAATAPTLASANVSPDAELLRLFIDWLAANKVSAAANAENNHVEEIMDAHDDALPVAARFKQQSVGRDDVWDGAYDELTSVTYGGPGTGIAREFNANAYGELREGLQRTDWSPCPNNARAHSQESPNHWRAPYSPPLRARVLEILAAWEPWEAERQRLSELHSVHEVGEAYHQAWERCAELERAIAAIPARGIDGYRVKATVVASMSYVHSKMQSALADYLAQDMSRSVDGMKVSLLLDLADWQAISQEALS